MQHISKNIQVGNMESNAKILNVNNPGIDIVFQNISYSVQIPDDSQESLIPCKKTYKQKQILKNVSGIFKAGHSTAIMGASGAGKTTLLNILACRIEPNLGGKRYANNLEYKYESFGDFANYVMQTDVLMQTLTVRQTLMFAANLKMKASDQQKKNKISQLSNELKLQKCLDTLIGGVLLKGVSGGQRKRVSIAFQLISDPKVLFLDQPTSGLDSLTSYIIVSQLNKLAKRQNKTIIMTIHQPNSEVYEIFDNLMLLLQGKIIYQGKASQITGYFQKNFNLGCPEFMNPPDFFMSKIHYEDQKNRLLYPSYFSAYQKNQSEYVNKQISNKQISSIQSRVAQIGFLPSLKPLIQREVINVFRNPMLLKSKFFQGIFISVFLGGLFFDIGKNDYTNINYWNSITGFMFFLTIAGMMTFLSPITLTFPSEKQIFFKEQDSRMYGVSQYFFARNIVQIPQLILLPLVVVSIYYFMVGLAPTGQQFFLHYLIFLLSGYAGGSLGLFIGSIILDAKTVSAVIPVVIMPVFIFAGFFKNRKDLPAWIGWIEYISPNKYAFIAHVKNQTAYKASLVDNLGFQFSKGQAIGLLIALGVGLRMLALFFLWYTKKKTQ